MDNLIWDADLQLWVTEDGRINSEIFCDFEDVHIEGDKQNRYKLKHNTTISSFQYTVVESKTDTLGGKYPFIRRNGDTYYRQFPIAGMITHFNENDYPEEYLANFIRKNASNANDEVVYDQHDFAEDGSLIELRDSLEKKRLKYVSKDSERENKYNRYYYNDLSLNGYTDYLLEKNYRDDVIDYFYQNKVRLFRSPTEGNILVKLMNITMTPNEQINRRVYNIQCTAFEVDEFTFENCIKYGIWDNDEGLFSDLSSSTSIITKVGQLQYDLTKDLNNKDFFIKTNFYEDIFNEVKQSLENFVSLDKVIWMKANFYSAPSYFGIDPNDSTSGKVKRVLLPNSEIVQELQGNLSESELADEEEENLIIEKRSYAGSSADLLYQSPFLNQTAFTDENNSYGLLQRLAYLVIKILYGDTFDLDNAKEWTEEQRDNFYREIGAHNICSTSGVLWINDDNDNTIIRPIIQDVFNQIFSITDVGESIAALFLLRYSTGLETDKLLDKVDEVMQFDDIQSQTALAFLRYSIGFLDDLATVFMLLTYIALVAAVGGKDDNDEIKGLGFGSPITTSSPTETTVDTRGYLVEDGESITSLKNLTRVDPTVAGHELIVNGNTIIVPPQVSYELIDEDTDITELQTIRLKDEPLKCLIDYVAQCHVLSADMLSKTRQVSLQYYKVGQIQTGVNGKNLITMIKNKYERSITTDEGSLAKISVVGVAYVSIEAEPYSVFIVQDSSGISYDVHVVNNTGVLTLYDPGTFILTLQAKKRRSAGVDAPSSLLINGNDFSETLEDWEDQEDVIVDRNEVVYSDTHSLNDMLINYIVLLKETRYV